MDLTLAVKEAVAGKGRDEKGGKEEGGVIFMDDSSHQSFMRSASYKKRRELPSRHPSPANLKQPTKINRYL
jgi:hypothetical protein